MSSYKNTHICYLPEQVIVRDVANVLNDEAPVSPEEERLRKRIDYSVQLLLLYGRAMAPLRDDALIKDTPFPYGM